MGLKDVFGKAEKVEEDGKLETVVSKESAQDNFIFKLTDYFEQSVPATKGKHCKQIFDDYTHYLKGSQELTPKIITNVGLVLGNEHRQKGSEGLFLSAMIQTSYDQGFNNFEFETVTHYFFGSYLRGKNNQPILIMVEKMDGLLDFEEAHNVVAEVKELNSNFAFRHATNIIAKIKQLNGNHTFSCAGNFVTEIQQYTGKDFGFLADDAKIYSPKLKILFKLWSQTFFFRALEMNKCSFHLGKIQEETKWD